MKKKQRKQPEHQQSITAKFQLGKVWDWIELIFNLATIYGLLSSLYWVYHFLTAPVAILISASTLTISGVPFSYVISSLFSMSLGGAYRSIKTLVHSALLNIDR